MGLEGGFNFRLVVFYFVSGPKLEAGAGLGGILLRTGRSLRGVRVPLF